MIKKYLWFIFAPVLVILVVLIVLIFQKNHKNILSTPTPSTSATIQISPSPSQKTDTFVSPIAQFKERITKKTFGMYITPANSPVQPERFTGYHTGVDVEYTDVSSDVPVYAISDGTIILARTASGYGGVEVLQINYQGKDYTVLYGHIRPSSLPQVGQKVSRGEQIGVLGTGYSAETDGERRHLHFSVRPGQTADIRGYVQSQGELSGWIDPLSLY